MFVWQLSKLNEIQEISEINAEEYNQLDDLIKKNLNKQK